MERPPLSRREREIMDILYRHGRATARTVQAELEEAPSYSAVRATLRILEEKGHVTHQRRGRSYLYAPATERSSARHAAVERLVDVFFGGSSAAAILALLDERAAELSDAEIADIEALIEQARKEGR